MRQAGNGVRVVRQSLLIPFAIASVVVSAEQLPREVFDNAIVDFMSGKIDDSIAGFDRVIKSSPKVAPELWQRGIALYYAGRFKDCRDQFALHSTVNPDDVENAAWHYLCVARLESPAAARSSLLRVGRDGRTPMSEVYALLQGRVPPAAVISAARGEATAEFYGHLYLGLYYEANGNTAAAKEQIQQAAAERFRAVGGYMYGVARVHLTRIQN